MASTIDLWDINKLINKKFYIPTYQRGYRWDEQQVKDLLNDLYEFKSTANTSNGEFYCLQPIVVMKNGDRYDVIDGQQRLTTILIILKYLRQRKVFTIDYATRERVCCQYRTQRDLYRYIYSEVVRNGYTA